MSDLSDLYQEVILDHNRRPRNFGVLEDADHQSEGFNPLCGDRVTVYVKLNDSVVDEISFQGSGCAISMASASIMTESLKGRKLEEVKALFERFHRLVTGNLDSQDLSEPDLGKLVVFEGVSRYPVRVKCATLTWHTLRAALEKRNEVVSTE
jgi:nitrogen fixation NifU-like protein